MLTFLKPKFWLFVGLTLSTYAIKVDETKGITELIGIQSTHGRVLLFAKFRPCGTGEDANTGRILISRDEGKSWQVTYSEDRGALFDSYATQNDKTWIAGVVYREGPEADPFVLVPEGDFGWKMKSIYRGPGEIEGIGFIKEPSHLYALIRHLKLTSTGWAGEVFLHESEDGGNSWKAMGQSQRTAPNWKPFSKITTNTLTWRIVKGDEGRIEIETRPDAATPWHAVHQLSEVNCSK